MKKPGDESVPAIDIKGISSIKENNVKSKLQEYENAVKKIKDATGVTDINEIIKKFAT